MYHVLLVAVTVVSLVLMINIGVKRDIRSSLKPINSMNRRIQRLRRRRPVLIAPMQAPSVFHTVFELVVLDVVTLQYVKHSLRRLSEAFLTL